jgi:hypothetical protein
MIKWVLDPHTNLAVSLLKLVRKRDTGDPTHRFQIAAVIVFLAGVDKALSLTLQLLYLAGHVEWKWLTGNWKKPSPGEVECNPGLTSKLKKLRGIGLDWTRLDWLVELRNMYVHDCSIYAGYTVDWNVRPSRLQLRASGPTISTTGPPLVAMDAAAIRAYADELARLLGSLLDRKGWSAAWTTLRESLSRLPQDPEPELSQADSAKTPEAIHEIIRTLNERFVGDGLEKLLRPAKQP